MSSFTVHPSLDFDYVMECAEQCQIGLDNTGFCLKCGMEHDSCEPDMRRGECDNCGEYAVYGAEECCLYMM